MPEVSEIHSAAGAVATAESALDQARQRLDHYRRASAAALDEAWNSWTDLAAAAVDLGVPADAESFAATQAELQAMPPLAIEAHPSELANHDPDPAASWLERCDEAVAGIKHDFAAIRDNLGHLIDNLLGQCGHALERLMLTVSGWESAGGHFVAARGDAQRQASQRDRQRDLLAQRQQRLAQLEASLGADADKVLADIDIAQQRLATHRSDSEAAQQQLEELQAQLTERTGAARTRQRRYRGRTSRLSTGHSAACGGSAMRGLLERSGRRQQPPSRGSRRDGYSRRVC